MTQQNERLLTEKDIDAVLDAWGLKPKGKDYSVELCKAQDAQTARIKDAEWQKHEDLLAEAVKATVEDETRQATLREVGEILSQKCYRFEEAGEVFDYYAVKPSIILSLKKGEMPE